VQPVESTQGNISADNGLASIVTLASQSTHTNIGPESTFWVYFMAQKILHLNFALYLKKKKHYKSNV
jgi:hypothetical protein